MVSKVLKGSFKNVEVLVRFTEDLPDQERTAWSTTISRQFGSLIKTIAIVLGSIHFAMIEYSQDHLGNYELGEARNKIADIEEYLVVKYGESLSEAPFCPESSDEPDLGVFKDFINDISFDDFPDES